MPNEIYQHTHQGLSRLVSARAATRVLQDALETQRENADSVSAERMSELLVGPVYRELRGALPKAGLKRHLKWLAARLRAVKPIEDERLREIVKFEEESAAGPRQATTVQSVSAQDPPGRTEAAQAKPAQVLEQTAETQSTNAQAAEARTRKAHPTEAEPAQTEAVAADAAQAEAQRADPMQEPGLQRADAKSDSAPERAEPRSLETPPLPEEATQAESAPGASTQQQAAVGAAVTYEPPSGANAGVDRAVIASAEQVERGTHGFPTGLPAATLKRIAHEFARLDHVKLIAAVRHDGEVVLSRGSGRNLESLFRYGPTALRLLKRCGQVRSYYLVHTQGQLFLLPFEDDTLILIGTTELNLGAVFTTLMKVEEEL